MQIAHRSAAAGVFSELEEIKKLAMSRPAARGGLDRLRGERIAVIAELDPTRSTAAAADLGHRYIDAGAGAVAVRVGSGVVDPDAVARISAHIPAPMVFLEPADTSHRIWQARACGADLVVIPAATLSDAALYSLLERAESIGMDAIVEVRTGADLVRALRARARGVLVRRSSGAVGSDDLLPMVPDGVVKLAECGADTRSGLIACARNGADAVLVAPTSRVGADPVAVVAELAAMGAHPALTARGSRAA